MTKKIKPQKTQRAQRGIREYGKWVSVISVVFEPIPENIKKVSPAPTPKPSPGFAAVVAIIGILLAYARIRI